MCSTQQFRVSIVPAPQLGIPCMCALASQMHQISASYSHSTDAWTCLKQHQLLPWIILMLVPLCFLQVDPIAQCPEHCLTWPGSWGFCPRTLPVKTQFWPCLPRHSWPPIAMEEATFVIKTIASGGRCWSKMAWDKWWRTISFEIVIEYIEPIYLFTRRGKRAFCGNTSPNVTAYLPAIYGYGKILNFSKSKSLSMFSQFPLQMAFFHCHVCQRASNPIATYLNHLVSSGQVMARVWTAASWQRSSMQTRQIGTCNGNLSKT